MKAVNFWKTLFCAALAVTAFTACSDDDDDGGYSGIPSVTVNGGPTTTIGGDLAGGKLEQTVLVDAKGDWELTFDNPSDAQWITPSKTSGKSGKETISFTLGQATADRTANLTVAARGNFEGVSLTRTASIIIKQTESGVLPTNALYSENCGTKVEKNDQGRWPYVDQYVGWTRGGSLDQKGVLYDGSSASVANSGNAFAPTDSEKNEVSGAPYVSMNTANSVFNIKDINIASNTNFTFTFTAIQQVAYSGSPVIGDVTDETIRFSVSTDGTTFSPVALKVNKIATGNWYLATAEFKLPAGVSVDKISVRFDGFAGLADHGLRIDDFKLYEGGNGAELGGGGAGDDYKKVTIDQITAAGSYELEGTTIVGVHSKGVLFAQNNGGNVNYILGFNNDWTTQTSNPYINDVDKTAGVKGKTEERLGLFQFSEFSVTLGGNSSLQLPAPATFDAAALDAYIAATGVYKYVKMTGSLGIAKGSSYNTYTLKVNGFDGKEIRIAYALDSYFTNFADGDVVDVNGFVLGYDSSKINFLLRSISKNASTPVVDITTDPATFAAASPVAQTLSYTFANTTAAEVTFSLEGASTDKFSLGTKTDNTIVVNAVGDNTSDAAYTAQLVAKVGGTTLASVELRQSAPISGAGYAKIEKVANLKAGKGYLAGLVKGGYQTWNGEISSDAMCVTVPYTYTESTGAFVADDAEAVEISLVAVDGVANAYYIKYGEKYLTVSKAGKNTLVLVDSADNNYWTFQDATDGMKGVAKAFDSWLLTSATAGSKNIRAYSTTATTKTGVIFFLEK